MFTLFPVNMFLYYLENVNKIELFAGSKRN